MSNKTGTAFPGRGDDVQSWNFTAGFLILEYNFNKGLNFTPNRPQQFYFKVF